MISFRVDETEMRGEEATMEARLGELLVGAVERVLPLLEFQGLEEELNKEPENIGGESWRGWEKRILTRLLFRMAEAVALQNIDIDSKEKTGDGNEVLDRRDNIEEHVGMKRKLESTGKEGNKRPKENHNDQNVEAETDPVSPSLLLDHGSQELDEEDHELVQVLAQMAEDARGSSSTSTPLVSDSCNPGVKENTDLQINMNQPSGKNTSALSGNAGVSKSFVRTSDAVEGASVRLAQTDPSSTPTPYPVSDARGGHPPHVQRASSTPAQIDPGRGNRILSNVTTPLPCTSTSPTSKILPSRTPSLPAPTSEPWWASRKVKIKSKTSIVSTPSPIPEAEREARGAENLETRGEIVQGAVDNSFETGKNGEKITAEENTGTESGDIASDEGEDEGKGKRGGKGGKSRAARRAEKRKLRREETPHA